MRVSNRTLWQVGAILVLAAITRAGDPPRDTDKQPTEAGTSARSDQTPKAGADADMAELAKGATTATIDRILDRAVHNIAVRYNLNDVQTDETGKMMQTRVHQFLREYENEVWPLIHEMLALQLKPPQKAEDLRRLGGAALPILTKAKEWIYSANEEWGGMLTPEQKRIHDRDMAEMDRTFEQIAHNFREWEEGRAPTDSIFPEQQLSESEPPRPPRPPDGKLPEKAAGVEMFDPNHILATLVEAFIKEYELDKGQITAARSILEEFKGKAVDMIQARKDEIGAVVKREQDALTNRDLPGLKVARTEHKKLLEPIYGLCDEMEIRLKQLLTTAQVQRHAEKTEGKPKAGEPSTPKTGEKTSATEKGESTGSGEEKPPAESRDAQAHVEGKGR